VKSPALAGLNEHLEPWLLVSRRLGGKGGRQDELAEHVRPPRGAVWPSPEERFLTTPLRRHGNVSSEAITVPNRGANRGQGQQLAEEGTEEAEEGREGGAGEVAPATEEVNR
jgi:hypothetical protein